MSLHNYSAALHSAIGATLQPLDRRIVPQDPGLTTSWEGTRFLNIVDDRGTSLAAVTQQYKLVDNRSIVANLDLTLDKLGIDAIASQHTYFRGRFFLDVTFPDLEFKVGTDPSPVRPMLTVTNDYTGTGKLLFKGGLWRQVCTNGMMGFTRVMADSRVHKVGRFDVGTFLNSNLERMVNRLSVERLLAETLNNTPMPAAEVFTGLFDRTPERYRPALRSALHRNVAESGRNLWGVSQALAEIATHTLTRSPIASHQWLMRTSRFLLESSGVTVPTLP